jgi:hypothetical protein
MIKSFGQKVKLEIFDKKGDLVFSSQKEKDSNDPYTSLRIDFHVIRIPQFNRAKFDIYNLNNKTVRELCSGEKFCKLSVALHDQPYEVLMDNLFISNAMRETILPNNVTSLYCYDKAKREVTESEINLVAENASVGVLLKKAVASSEGTASVKFKNFPKQNLDYKYVSPKYLWNGSVGGLFDKLGKAHGFKWFIEDDTIVAMFLPSLDNVKDTDLGDDKIEPDIILQTRNMRATPKISPAAIQIVSNLDARIKPTSVLDSSKLVTASTASDIKTLQTAEDFLKNPISGFSKFQCVGVEHQGSNFTKKWETRATAYTPETGTKLPLYNWHGIKG